MKWLKICGALLAAMSMNSLADAGLLGALRGDCGGAKGCGCAATCQPQCCKPVIVKPCCPNVYTYQRKCSDIKPPCCDTCCPPATCCAPAACAPACAAPAAACAPAACAPAPAACAPACAAPAAACAPAPAACAPACAAPAATACAPAPAACAPACAAPAACGPKCAPACAAPMACAPAACTPACAPACCTPKKGLLSGLFGRNKKSDCGAPAACTPACEVRCCNADPCEVATLIYESQTACKAKDRKKAIHKLGDKFDCICNPEIMTAFIVGLNDCDEDVRAKAADEIGDQIRKNCCCCPEVVAALTCALGDCDKHVVKQAKEALELCGYEVVDGCCNTCGNTGCTTTACGAGACGTGYAPAPAAAPAAAPAPAPVPPQDGQARKGGLGQLLGLLD